jgi:hypothetical protein
VLALDLLGVALARAVNCGREVSFVGTPGVCIVARDAERLQQCLQLYKDLVRTPPKNIGQDLPSAVIKGMPQPARLFLLPHKTPHFVHFGGVYTLDDDLDVAREQTLD